MELERVLPRVHGEAVELQPHPTVPTEQVLCSCLHPLNLAEFIPWEFCTMRVGRRGVWNL